MIAASLKANGLECRPLCRSGVFVLTPSPTFPSCRGFAFWLCRPRANLPDAVQAEIQRLNRHGYAARVFWSMMDFSAFIRTAWPLPSDN